MIEVNKESLERFVNNTRNNVRKQQEEIYNLLNNSSYMDELIRKIKKDSYVFEYDNGDNKLSILYKIINDYVKNSDFVPVVYHDYKYFYVEHNDYIFALYKKSTVKGIMYGCFPVSLNKKDLPYYIKYDDIRNDKAMNINSLPSGLIVELRDVINKMVDEGFTYGFIEQLVGNIIEAKESSNNESKRLSK